MILKDGFAVHRLRYLENEYRDHLTSRSRDYVIDDLDLEQDHSEDDLRYLVQEVTA